MFTGYCCLYFAACLAACFGHEDTLTEVEFGDSLVLNCSMHHAGEGITVVHWVVPDHLQIYSPGKGDRKYKVRQWYSGWYPITSRDIVLARVIKSIM